MPLATQSRSPAQHRLALIVEEALSAVLAPDRRDTVLHEALTAAGVEQVPERPSSLRVFVEGALFSVLARHLEVSDALELVAQIRSALELALSTAEDERPKSDVRDRITLPAPPARVLVVTGASLVVFLLGDVVGENVEVVPVTSAGEVRDRLRRWAGTPLLVVVDRKHACVDASICPVLREQLGDRSTVVWWGAPSDEQTVVTSMLLGGPRAITCDADMRLADLGQLCARLLEDPS